ncbi:hypothetical protein Taro_011010 [Colocasia esculenta]|uniref:Uncharacterized protein n=1 Tax=Colocasia esculenta TaxID=4460 RepID=A0A843U4Q9_COLES|nr:hypothetical protein [Colocasia esculenta]
MSRVSRILVDPVFSGCNGYREANVVYVWYVCVSKGLIRPIVWACSTLVSSACHRDREECRVLNATEVTVAFWWPPWGVDRVFLCVFTDVCMISLVRLRPVRGRRTRIKFVSGLMGLNEASRHSWYQSKKFEMADRRDWGDGGEDPKESTQRMIESIWETLTDIRMRMDQQAPVPPAAVPPVAEVPVAPVVPPPRVEVPYVAPVPPPVMTAEELVMQVEKFLRLQPPTYTGGPNPDTAEHWIHEVERVFTTMRCPAADKVVLATYQLRGFAQQWWRLKMQTTFAASSHEELLSFGRTEDRKKVLPHFSRTAENATEEGDATPKTRPIGRRETSFIATGFVVAISGQNQGRNLVGENNRRQGTTKSYHDFPVVTTTTLPQGSA